MRKTNQRKTKPNRTATFRGRLSPVELAAVKAAQKDGGFESISDLLLAGLEALAIIPLLRDVVEREMGEWYAVSKTYLPYRLWGMSDIRNILLSLPIEDVDSEASE